MSKTKTLEIEKLTRHKEVSYIVLLVVHTICYFGIATDKVLVEKQEEIEILHEKMMSLTLELKEREEAISQLMEKMKSKKKYKIYQ